MTKVDKEYLRQLEETGDVMELNLGPQHPSTHGVLRLKLRLEGEVVLSCDPVIGYLHTGVEKECESRTYHQVFTLVDRLDYLSGPAEEQAFAGAVERMMQVEVPERAQTIRIILLELSRIASHLIWAGTSALELNMSSVFMYSFAEREKILDLFEEFSGARMFPSVWRIGGLSRDLDPNFEANLREFIKGFPKIWKELDNLLTNNYVWCERLKGVAVIDEELCKQYMCTGPVLRGAGVAYDIRKAYPYLGYETYQFDIPTYHEADSYARYLVRMEEMRQSLSIIEQALGRLKPGPVLTNDRKVALPPRRELARSMEAVIHQFKLVSEGIHPPVGGMYNCVESARGELGHYLISDGSPKPYRLRVRSPSFSHIEVLKEVLPGHVISDVVVAIASVDPILGDVDR
ncbi:NADH dehydrogenase I, D subunit [Candidatus Protochlamydia naegleriophila]|uniref:NADH-quinone oxidoreductase subunit D n=1 Tax=Candidatus Protochlamydia naegleriophila TaxID=389348 RepID=A0A0U5ET68_9BACT|nr:NADH-quinone oxidoreductase subunit D [Candidatus Protochlamydia naegleriophila]CUI17361.1 NADH dehydrogenase I, D subunit [Candidatus Protochlamydia naegleriophila]